MANFHFYYIYDIPVENNLYNSLKNYCFKNECEPPS